MNRVRKSELATGMLFKKLLLLIIWIAWTALTLYMVSNTKQLLFNDHGEFMAVYIIVLAIFIILTIRIPRFLLIRNYSIPCWGQIFSNAQLKKLFEDQHFEELIIPELPALKNVYLSENWLQIGNYYFLRPLISEVDFYTPGGRNIPNCFIDYITGNDSYARNVKNGLTTDEEVKTFRIALQKLLCPERKIGMNFPYESSDKAFSELWKDRDLKELPECDMNSLRKDWVNLTYNVYYEDLGPEDEDEDEDENEEE